MDLTIKCPHLLIHMTTIFNNTVREYVVIGLYAWVYHSMDSCQVTPHAQKKMTHCFLKLHSYFDWNDTCSLSFQQCDGKGDRIGLDQILA